MSTVSDVSQKTVTSTVERTAKDQSQLGKDDFMKLLVTQLRYQDPMKPMEDKEFIAQMAQFSALEQMQNMNASILTAQATNMIGKKVTWLDDDGQTLSGLVKAVNIIGGTAKLAVGDTNIAMDKITQVKDAV